MSRAPPGETGTMIRTGRADSFAPAQLATPPRARQRSPPDAEIDGATGAWRSCAIAARQAHREHRTLARLARHRHVAAHHARELAREGKAEPRPAKALCGRGIGLAKLLEQLSLLLRSHANAGVSDRELDPVATVGNPARPQPDLAFLRELAGIAQQIEQYLSQPRNRRLVQMTIVPLVRAIGRRMTIDTARMLDDLPGLFEERN